jgi:hypothetical protein
LSILRTRLKAFWGREYSFNFLLILVTVYIFVVLPLVHHDLTEKVLFFVFYFLLLSNSLPFLIRNKRTGLIYVFTMMPSILLMLDFFLHDLRISLLIDIFVLIYLLMLIWAFLFRTFSKGTMDRNRVQGAILVYLLLAFSFAFIYHAIYLIEGQNAIKGLLFYNRREFIYFSLSSLTTVGYGDVIPVNELARSMANLESLTGQLYPAVLIARLVSLENGNSNSK